MKRILLLPALIAALGLAAPASAQRRPASAQPGHAALVCSGPQFAAERRAIARLPVVAEQTPAGSRQFCLRAIALPRGAPFRRLAVAQFTATYWCGTAGCTVLFFVQEPGGAWREVTPNEELTNAPPGARVRIDPARAVSGMPAIAYVQAGGGARPRERVFRWDPRAGTYR